MIIAININRKITIILRTQNQSLIKHSNNELFPSMRIPFLNVLDLWYRMLFIICDRLKSLNAFMPKQSKFCDNQLKFQCLMYIHMQNAHQWICRNLLGRQNLLNLNLDARPMSRLKKWSHDPLSLKTYEKFPKLLTGSWDSHFFFFG